MDWKILKAVALDYLNRLRDPVTFSALASLIVAWASSKQIITIPLEDAKQYIEWILVAGGAFGIFYRAKSKEINE